MTKLEARIDSPLFNRRNRLLSPAPGDSSALDIRISFVIGHWALGIRPRAFVINF